MQNEMLASILRQRLERGKAMLRMPLRMTQAAMPAGFGEGSSVY
jgi:hypothetical protein